MFLDFHLVWFSHKCERDTVGQRPKVYGDNSRTSVAEVKNVWRLPPSTLLKFVLCYTDRDEGLHLCR